MSLSHLKSGPWTTIFEGSWEKHKVEFMQNPDKETLTLIHDSSGQVAILNRYFVFEGNHEKIISRLDSHSQIIEKYYPNFKAKYFVISTGPKYYGTEELDHGIETELNALNDISEMLNRYSIDAKAKILELKNAKSEYIDELFSEPITLASVTSREYKGEIIEAKKGNFVLGQEITGGDAVEEVDSFNIVVVEGNIVEQIHAMKVIAENCVSNNINAIVFDENNYFEKMSFPNKNLHEFERYANLQPVGMPVKTPALETIPIDLNMLNEKMLRELIGTSGDENFHGYQSVKIIGRVLEKYREKIEDLGDIENLVLKEKNDEDKYHTYKAARILKIMQMTIGAYLGGKTNIRNLTSGKLNRMGVITRIDISDLPEAMRKLFILSVIRTLVGSTGKQMEHIVFIPDAEKFAGKNAKGEIDAQVFNAIEDTFDKGVGICAGAETETTLNPEIADNKTLMIDFISENEVAIKSAKKRSYRAKLRPTLSG